jgi:hypothetical protein
MKRLKIYDKIPKQIAFTKRGLIPSNPTSLQPQGGKKIMSLFHPDRGRSWRRLRSLEKTRSMNHHLKLTTILPSPVEPTPGIVFQRDKIYK